MSKDTIGKNWTYFKEHYPDIHQAYQAYGQAVHEKAGPLDEKTRWLVKIAASTSGQHPYALKTHIRKGLAAGLSEKEVEHAIILTAPTAGFPTMMEGLLTLRETLDEGLDPVMTP